jgi:hypothetical protein
MATAGSDPGRAVLVQLASASPAGGWCSIIGKAPGSPMTAADADAIADRAAGALQTNPLFLPGSPFGMWVQWTRDSIRRSLQPWVDQARACDTVPNNLTEVPGVQDGIPGSQGAGPIINNLLDFTGLGPILGDMLIKGGVLVGIIVLLLMAIRRVLA